jgi:hypothetical protein
MIILTGANFINLFMTVVYEWAKMSSTVCPGDAFTVQSNVCE